MKSTRHNRLLLIVLAIATLGIAGWAGYEAIKAVGDLSGKEPIERLTHARRLYTEIAAQATEAGFNLSQPFSSTGTNEVQRVRTESEKLAAWLAGQKSKPGISGKQIAWSPIPVTTDIEPLLNDIEKTLAEYNASIQATNIDAARVACRKLVILASQSSGRAEGIDNYLSLRTGWRRSYIKLLLISLGLLTGFAVWLGILLYRLVAVRPLRMRLVESTATIERQQKLAHFGELAAGLAHEIRNPLTAINARLYTLQKFLSSDGPASEDAAVIHNEINRLDRIVKDFLKLARPAEPQLASVRARPLMEEVWRLMSPTLLKRRIDLQLEATVDTPFRADPQQLKQVLINLVQNAADAIGEDGTVTLSARFSLEKLRGHSQEVVVLEVRDTGPGISPEAEAHMFDPFFSTKDEGTGLGLPISARIVDQHGGEINFRSQLGGGTTFGIVLPVGGAGYES